MPVSTLENGGKDNTIPVSQNILNYIKYMYMFIISKHSYNDKYMSIIIRIGLGMVAIIFNPNTQEAEVFDLCELKASHIYIVRPYLK